MPDTLIYAMSTRGAMNLEQFNELFRHAYFASGNEDLEPVETDARRETVRILDSLGICEFDFDRRMVYMCRPGLVLLPSSGLPRAALVGARTPGLIQKLKLAVRERRSKAALHYFHNNAANAVIPDSYCIEAIDMAAIQDIADRAGVSFESELPAAWELANMSASLAELSAALKFEGRMPLNWKCRVFSTERLMFSIFNGEPSGTFLAEYRNPVSQQRLHRFWRADAAAEVSRDWSRYLYLHESGCNVLLYDERFQKLAVPVTVPLPCLLARAAALCTACPPKQVTANSKGVETIPPSHPLHLYSGVPPAIAELIAEKLGQKLFYTSFEQIKGGVLND